VVESGTHDELLARGGMFARFHEIQLQREGAAARGQPADAAPEKRGEDRPPRRAVGA
jgi:hypothetical protein